MKRHLASALLTFSLIASAIPAAAQAPATSPQVKVDLKRVVVGEQGTPDFSAGNVNMKRWRPKKWIEVDVEFDIKVPQDAGGRNGSYSGLQMNLYLVFNARTKDNKYEAAKSTLTLTNVPAGETCHALAYIAPADLRSILQKDNFTSADISGWGVEFIADGKTIAGDGNPKPSSGNIWWEKTDNFAFRSDVIKAKSETPFGILFGDYDVQAKTK
ncbi:MAG: hypothetical protein IPK32_05590 [Verrucomicrobiaceae bacterium]|nr:hypothetical protein [Verrucomicrobiaceae bacterium]